MNVPSDLYDQIYKNASKLPGYNRYYRYQSEIAKQPNPLKWLGEQEAAYWFVRHEIEKLTKNIKILEIGSGLGYLSFAIKSAGYNIVGVDISEKAVSDARAVFGDIYECRDLFKLAAEPTRYDVVIMTEVIEHVSAPIEFLKAASAVLNPSGKILMTTPNKSVATLDACWETENPPVHLWWFSEGAVRQLASRADLTVDFCDFTAMHTGEDRQIQHFSVAGRPAWLDPSGDITPEAANFITEEAKRSDRTLSPKSIAKQILRNVGPKIYKSIRINGVVKEYRPASLQRSWQIGAVLQRNRQYPPAAWDRNASPEPTQSPVRPVLCRGGLSRRCFVFLISGQARLQYRGTF